MPARNNAAYYVAELSRDQGFSGATVHVDPTKWTSRRRNIVLRALNDGLTSCGHDTAYFIECLTRAYGGSVQTLTKWSSSLSTECVKEEELDNLIAYTCAWIRIALANSPNRAPYHWQNWLRSVSNGQQPSTIPTPDISDREKVDFIKQYLKDDDETKTLRQSLARMIEKGETLSINVKAA